MKHVSELICGNSLYSYKDLIFFFLYRIEHLYLRCLGELESNPENHILCNERKNTATVLTKNTRFSASVVIFVETTVHKRYKNLTSSPHKSSKSSHTPICSTYTVEI